ncbi:MAG: M48 family metallopeptidase [Alphaproteobacteria bacterium]|nr:M48 family metallopeptidase [Alphaproteobacteria bacterium]
MMMRFSTSFKMNVKKSVKWFLAGFMALIFAGLSVPGPEAHAQSGPAPVIIRDTEIEDILKEWTRPLRASSGLNDVKIVLVQSSDVNAFVAGGANIFLYTGLISKTESPGELLGVIAHEMGHIAGGHLISTRSAMQRASYESILGAVLGIGAAIATGKGGAASAIIAGSSSMAANRFLAYSRVNESSADQAAFTYLSQSGNSASGLVSFFKKLESEELLPATQQSAYMRTHPVTRDRIQAVGALVARSSLKEEHSTPAQIEQHARIKAKLIGFITPQQVAWTYDERDSSVAARYARSIAAYRMNDLAGALKYLDPLITAEPKNPYFQEFKGQILVDFSRIEDGIPYYRRAVELLPDAPLLRVALAHALIESGDNPARLKEAITHLQRALKTENRTTRPHRLLATAYGRLGQESMAKLHLAEEGVMQGRVEYAKSQAEGALAGFQEGAPEAIRAHDLLAYIETLGRRSDSGQGE